MLARRPDPRVLPRTMGAAIGLPAGVAAVLVTQFLGGHPVLGLALAALAAAVLGGVTTAPGAAAGAALCWACHDGFTVNGLGELGTAPGELVALAVVVGAALAVRAVRVASGTPAARLPAGYPVISPA